MQKIYEKLKDSAYAFLQLISNNAIKEKFLLNSHIPCSRASLLFLISITLVFSPLYLLPLAYSQEPFSSNGTFISRLGGYGAGNGMLKSPTGIAIDPSSGNIYVDDTDNHRIQVFSNSTIGQ